MQKQVRRMDRNETLLIKYTEKIYGFAYSKTHNYHDALDLSQNILLTLCQIDFASPGKMRNRRGHYLVDLFLKNFPVDIVYGDGLQNLSALAVHPS